MSNTSNTIEIKPNSVVKTFSSRMSFVREVQVYEKLRGTGLAPEMISSWDGALEHKYIPGEDFGKLLFSVRTKPLEFVKYCKIFCDWYKTFRETINMSLGETDFSDFIYCNGKIYGIDFEHCRPGNVEEDIAAFAAQIAFMEGSYSLLGIENAKIFIKFAWDRFSMTSSRLYQSVKTQMQKACAEKNIVCSDSINEYLATFVCCSFVRVTKKGIDIPKIMEVLHQNHQVWTAFAMDVTGDSEKILTYMMTAEKEGYDVLYLTKGGQFVPFPLMFRTDGANLSLEFLKIKEKNLQDIIVNRLNSKALPLENLG